MKKIYLLIFLIAISSRTFGQVWEWLYTEQDENLDTGLKIIPDSHGNFYLYSFHSNGNYASGSSGNERSTIQKFSASRDLLWTKQIAAFYLNIRSVFQYNDIIYIHGSYGGGSDPLLIPGKVGPISGAFVMLIDSLGNITGGDYIENGSKGSRERGSFIQYNNSFYYIGDFNSVFALDSDTLVTSSGQQCMVMKLDENFNVLWHKTFFH